MKSFPKRAVDMNKELEQMKTSLNDPEVIATYESKTSPTEARLYRNKVVYTRIRAIDLHFCKFQQRMSQEGASFNIGSDWIGAGVNAAGTIVHGANAKTALHAVSGGVLSARGSVNTQLYYDQTIGVLFAKMASQRKEVLARIYAGLDLGVDDYSLQKALLDVEEYYHVGSLAGAITGVATDAGTQTKVADAKIDKLVQGTFDDDENTRLLRKFWKPDGKVVDQDNEKLLLGWIDANIKGTLIPELLNMGQFKAWRAEAVKFLKLK